MEYEYNRELLEKAARCLKVLAHPTRLLIIHLLGQKECSGKELKDRVKTSQPNVSQHLNLLKDRDIVESRREAQKVIYRLKDARVLQLARLTRELFCRE